ncbi:hypothetical protein [Salipiger mangrovisoli]|uniref:HdeA/HdeB family protein n=1 Tax=Salipiger mangrovisoli TaxID=2865933 RepID=A0ABR9X7N5_9RHOB|nr:hypothetical protein [Salipiger mangrovisoli]MBE9639452.1 hypothetical protein [Salipiger mangrovisoli]
MRTLVVLGLVLAAATPAFAQSDKAARCESSAKMVMEAVQARKDGVPQKRTERELRRALDRDAGVMLAQWIYALPEDQLNLDVGRSWEQQCLSQ